MISIIRAKGISPDLLSGSRTIDALNNEFSEAPPICSIKRLIIIKKINPEEFEDQEVNNMSDEKDLDLSPEEIDGLENEIPAEADEMSDEELGEMDDDIDDLEGSEGDEGSDGEEDMTDEDLDALEKEIPPEADNLKDEDLEADPDLDDEDEEESGDETGDESVSDKDVAKNKKDNDLEESTIIKGDINDYI